MDTRLSRLSGLVVGGRDTLSLGRVAFWLVFGLCFWFWAGGREVPPSLENSLGLVLAYNLGGKAVSGFSRRGRPEDGDGER